MEALNLEDNSVAVKVEDKLEITGNFTSSRQSQGENQVKREGVIAVGVDTEKSGYQEIVEVMMVVEGIVGGAMEEVIIAIVERMMIRLKKIKFMIL